MTIGRPASAVATLLVVAAVVAAPASASAVNGGIIEQVRDEAAASLPQPLPSTPPELPDLPDLPSSPVTIPAIDPPVPVPVPVPSSVPVPSPVPTASGPRPAPAEPAAAPAARGPLPSPADAAASPAPRTSGARSRPPGARTRSRAGARRENPRTGQSTRRPTPARQAAGRVALSGDPATARVVTPAPERSRPQSAAARLLDDVGELIVALPPAVLWALLGMAGIALWLAGNAYWQSRQREALEIQRAELLEDVGLLSSALLPPSPDAMERLIVSAAYRPADGPAAGGDFYDVFPLDDERIGIVLGDVSGHGRDSVTQAALARYTLRTLLSAGHGPADALARADRMLARDLPPHFVTAIAAVYDHRRTELTYAKAGHAPPIVLGMAHDPDAEEPACPLGLGIGDHWPEFSLEMTEHASVCLYTDGLEDARLDGVRLGREQVMRFLMARDQPDATQLIADIGEYADRIGDDTAAVILRRRA